MADGRKTIRFTLNGRPATADVAPHENLIEVLQRDFALHGARVSCARERLIGANGNHASLASILSGLTILNI